MVSAVIRAIPDVLVGACWWAVGTLALWIEVPDLLGDTIGQTPAMVIVGVVSAALACIVLMLVRAVHQQPALRDQVIAAAELSRARLKKEHEQDLAA